MMKDGILNLVSRKPLNNPMRAQTTREMRMPTAQAISMGMTEESPPETRATITPLSATVDPTERSISPAMMTKVIPKAMIPVMDMLRSMLNRLPVVRKLLEVKLTTTINKIRISSSICLPTNFLTVAAVFFPSVGTEFGLATELRFISSLVFPCGGKTAPF